MCQIIGLGCARLAAAMAGEDPTCAKPLPILRGTGAKQRSTCCGASGSFPAVGRNVCPPDSSDGRCGRLPFAVLSPLTWPPAALVC